MIYFEIRSRWVEEFKFNLDHIKAAKPGLVRTIVRIGKEKAHARARSQRATEVNVRTCHAAVDKLQHNPAKGIKRGSRAI